MSPWKILYRTIISHYVLLSGLLLTGLIQASCSISIPWLLKNMIDAAIDGANVSQLNQIGLIVLGLSAALYFSYVLDIRIGTLLIQKGIYELRRDLYSRILKQPLSFTKSVKTGELMHHVQQDTNLFEKNVEFLVGQAPVDVFSVVGIFVLMFITSKFLLFLILIFMTISLILTIFIGRPLSSLTRTLQKIGARFNAKLHDVFNGIRTVKSFGRETDEIKDLDEINAEMITLQVNKSKIESLIEPFAYLMEIMGVILVIWFGSYLIVKNRFTPGILVAFLMYVEILAEPFSRIVKYFESSRICHAVSQRLSDFINQLNQSKSLVFKGIKPYTDATSITFDNVSFQYDGTNHVILDKINFTANAGKITAIVGRNGVGKSTLMDLLIGLQIPNEGQILIEKTPMCDFKEPEWRKKIGVLSQDIYIFNDTIEKNIAYGKAGATITEINDAATKAGLKPFLARLPEGLKTKVGEKGGRLSGGERQKIAIARLFLQNPNLIIFDEATSHLDTESLQEFVLTIMELAKNRVVLLIEHRFEVIMQVAAQIVLIDAGKIVAIGTHEELIKKHSIYRSLLQ